MDATQLVSEVINILTSAIVPFGTKLAQGVGSVVHELVFTTTGTGAEAVTTLNPFISMVLIFASVALAVGLSRWIVNFIGSLGARNR